MRGPSRSRQTRGGRVGFALVLILPVLLVVAGDIGGVWAQITVPVEPPYTVMDAERRTRFEVGVEAPLRGNGPLSGYGYVFLTRPYVLHENLYLRAAIAPIYATGELIRDRWPTTHSALGFGLAGGILAASHLAFRDGGFDKARSFSGDLVEGTLAYYVRGPLLGGLLPLEGQVRLLPTYVMYHRTGDTSLRFRLPEDSAVYRMRAGIRLGGVPPDLFPEVAAELSLWHLLSYREAAGRFGLPERPQETEHLTQATWLRLGGIYSFRGTQASAFLTAGVAGDTDALSAFRLGGGLRMRTEFPFLLHGYNVDEILARRFWLVNLAYRFRAPWSHEMVRRNARLRAPWLASSSGTSMT